MRRGVFATCAVIACSILALIWLGEEYFHAPGPAKQQTTVIIAEGSSLDTITNQLMSSSIVKMPWLFNLHVRFRGKSHLLKAGEYSFPAQVNPSEALTKLLAGDVVLHTLTIVEGLNAQEIFEQLNATTELKHDVAALPNEGSCLPETYYFTLGESGVEIIRRMQQSMGDTLNELWEARVPELPLRTPEETLVLASIVEKEAHLSEERPRIAAVFINRLRRGMKLQADPTVAYGLMLEGKLQNRLSADDLAFYTPYNTYLIGGLPPTPICNPGRASIAAVLNPLKTDELYFVADGSGGHKFSATYHEHRQGHQNLRRLRKKVT